MIEKNVESLNSINVITGIMNVH